jgi:ABC-type glycerol-3-phosphate transport system substrate-binding protein
MKDNFQIIIVIIFIVGAIFGVLVFSGLINIGKDTSAGSQGTVVLWGTVKAETMLPVVEAFNAANPSFILKYVQKSGDTFDADLLEALASQNGPDLFFMPENLAFHYANKIFTVPYTSYPIASFKGNFAGGADVFLTAKGMLAFPLTIDPLVLYYNQSMLDANSIVYPPKTWDALLALVPTLTKKDDSNKISKSTIALGQFSNVTHAKDIISALFLQGGNPIISQKDGRFVSTLTDISKYNLNSILKFYTDFADPLNPAYSWNKSFPSSLDSFTSENLAFYIGYASEIGSIVNRNPNLNFGVASLPQIQGSNTKVTGGRVSGVAISAFSKNFNTAFIAAGLMSSGDFAKTLANGLGIAPVRRDLLQTVPADPYSPTFYSSALVARSWLDPSPKDSENVFRGMVESVLSNNLSIADAIRDAHSKLSLLLVK